MVVIGATTEVDTTRIIEGVTSEVVTTTTITTEKAVITRVVVVAEVVITKEAVAVITKEITTRGTVVKEAVTTGVDTEVTAAVEAVAIEDEVVSVIGCLVSSDLVSYKKNC